MRAHEDIWEKTVMLSVKRYYLLWCKNDQLIVLTSISKKVNILINKISCDYKI